MVLVYVTFGEGTKLYSFLDTQDLVQKLNLGVGSVITDERYDNKLTIRRITDPINVVRRGVTYYLNNLPLKSLRVDSIETPTTVATIPASQQPERTISLTINKAREWYNSGNSALKALALQMYTENEILDIPESVEEICKRLNMSWNIKWSGFTEVEVKSLERHLASIAVARYLNKGWKKSVYEDGFFIGYVGASSPAQIVAHIDGNLAILSHHTVKYPDLVYFRTAQLAAKAYKLLKKYYK